MTRRTGSALRSHGETLADARRLLARLWLTQVAGDGVLSTLPAALWSKLAPFRRDAYDPQTEVASAEHNDCDKFGGLPYLRKAKDWPRCTNCRNPMQLLVQLDRVKLPDKASRGLLQLFYCVNGNPHCEVDCQAWHPNRTSTCIRVIEVTGPSAIAPCEVDRVFPERRVVGWRRSDDYPGSTECRNLGVKLNEDERDALFEAGYAQRGDKLFGWPNWIQSVEYHLPVSSLFLQLASDDNLPHAFGAYGTGHLTRSDLRPDEMAFGWAC